MTLKERIDEGLLGKYQGLNNGFKRLNKYIFGVQRGVKTLIGGDSGTGKTSLLDFILLNAIEDANSRHIPIDVFYDSWEIKEFDKKINWCSQIIYNKYNIIIPPEKIKGLGNNRLTVEEQEIVFSELDYIEQLFDKIHFNFVPENPTGWYYKMWEHGKANGTFEYEDYQTPAGETKQKIKKYIPNNSNKYTITALDHQFYLRKERGFEVKETIDKYWEYQVEVSNMFNFSHFTISQFNDGLSAVERQKFKGVDLSPSKSDFKDSRNPYADADVVIGMMNPSKMDMKTCMKYDITKLGKKFLMLKLCKNRLSEDNVSIGMHFKPEAGVFDELPFPNEIKYEDYE